VNDPQPIFDVLRQAVTLTRRVQETHILQQEKAGREPVTLADYGSQAIVCHTLQQHFPDYAVMSEESGKQFLSLLEAEQQSEIADLISSVLERPVEAQTVAQWLDHGKGVEHSMMWVIDPIDGTKGFLRQEHYVVAVALMQDRKPIAGFLAAPEYPGGGRIIYAIDGKAFYVPLAGGDPQPITVSQKTDATQMIALESVEKSHSSFDRMAKVRAYAGMNSKNIVRADSQEKYGRIASGDAEVYLRLPRKDSTRAHSIWDHAAGAAIVEAAGGKVTDVDGSPLDYSDGNTLNNMGVIATNGAIHDRLVEAVQRMLSEETD